MIVNLSRLGIGLTILSGLAVVLCGCGERPTAAPEQLGSIIVTAQLEGTPADTMLVILDDDTLGWRDNPDTLYDVSAGNHLVGVSTIAALPTGGDTLLPPQFQSVAVFPGAISSSSFTLELDREAPNFTLVDVLGDTVCLDSLAGQVKILYFFSMG